MGSSFMFNLNNFDFIFSLVLLESITVKSKYIPEYIYKICCISVASKYYLESQLLVFYLCCCWLVGCLPNSILILTHQNQLILRSLNCSLFEIGSDEQEEVGHRQIHYSAECVWPTNLDHIARHKQLIGQLGNSYTSMTHMPSDLTCIKVSKKYSQPDNETLSKHFVYPLKWSWLTYAITLTLFETLSYCCLQPFSHSSLNCAHINIIGYWYMEC